MEVSVINHDMNYVDYVCIVCHLLASLPDNDQSNIYSARLKIFPHSSATDLLAEPEPLQIARLSLLVLYKTENPPTSLVKLMRFLSHHMVKEYFCNDDERGAEKSKYHTNYDGLRLLADKLGTLKKLRLYFSFDAEASSALKISSTLRGAISNPRIRRAMQSALEKVDVTPNVAVERLQKQQNGSLDQPKANALFVGLNNETLHGLAPFESALKSYIEEHLPHNQVLRQSLIWPKQSPGPLPGYKFMDQMTVSGLSQLFEARYSRIKKLSIPRHMI